MPENASPRSDAFGQYDVMSTEELQQILRENASKPEGAESDMEMLLYIMDVLAKRRRANLEGKTPEEALETFIQQYYTENEISSDSESSSAAHQKCHGVRWMKSLIAAAAALVLTIGGSFTANAVGFDVWEVIAKWTQETFHLGYSGEIEESFAPSSAYANPCASLQDALYKNNVTLALVPHVIPNGYVEGNVHITQTPKHRAFIANYICGDNEIIIRLAEYLDSFPMQIEQSDSLVETYVCDEINYYIFDNEGTLQAVWINENFECFISGPLTLSELKEMIDSIEKG